MDDNEKELLKVGADAAMRPFASLIEKLFGGAVEQIGGAWEDRLAVRRKMRQIRHLQKLKAAIEEAGFDPQQIPDAIWIPAIQEASLQDDNTIQQQWANLLANAADPRDQDKVLPSYVAILRELRPADALFLNALYLDVRTRASAEKKPFVEIQYDIFGLKKLYDHGTQTDQGAKAHGGKDGIAVDNRFLTFIEIMARHWLLVDTLPSVPMRSKISLSHSVTKTMWSFSHLGWSFIGACQAPTKTLPVAPEE